MDMEKKVDRWLNGATLIAVLLTAALMWPINRAILTRPDAPVLSGRKIEYVKRTPNGEPSKIILELEVGEEPESWTVRLAEMARELENFHE